MSTLDWPGDHGWILFDVLTTTSATRDLAETERSELVRWSDRFARIWCDVGMPHVVIGERLDALDLVGHPAMAPFAPLTSADDARATWNRGGTCCFYAGVDTVESGALGAVLAELVRDRPMRGLFIGAAALDRFAPVADALAPLLAGSFVAEGAARDDVVRTFAWRTSTAAIEERYRTPGARHWR